MRKKAIYRLLLPILLVWPGFAHSQKAERSFYLWKLHSFSGEASFNGLYRAQERSGLNIYENQKSSYFSGGVLLKTNSSILNQNFLILDIDAGYMPETSRDNFIIIPDQAEVRTLKKLGIGASFLRQKKITFNLLADYGESYSSRENLTDIKALNKHWGGTLAYASKFLPVTVDFHSRKWEENEIQTGRRYTLDQNTFGARMSKSFTSHDRNDFKYTHDDNVNVNQNLFRIANTIDNLEFISFIHLDSQQKYTLNTMISDWNQGGNMILKRVQASETFNAKLPLKLSFFGNYNYYNISQNESQLKQNSLITSIEHRLFNSLQSRVNFDYNIVNHSVYQEFNTKIGLEFNYSKTIPTGQLLISYKIDRYHQDFTSAPFALNIHHEQYILSDNKINLLKVPDIQLSSVVVRDTTGTVTYLSGLDYILLERNRFIEIRRVPGGSISNNAVVYLDYTAVQPGAYRYDANTQIFTSSIYLLKNLLSLYYRYSTQDYSNLEKTEFVTLNYFTQNLGGCRLDFKSLNGGIEYEDYKSSILPYRMTRYYANFQHNYGKKVMVLLNGNLQDYTMLDETIAKKQRYMDLTGKVIYTMFGSTNLNVDMMYRNQSGRGIDLDLLTARTEVTSNYHRLYITMGVELYRRNYVGEKINFNGTYLKIARKF